MSEFVKALGEEDEEDGDFPVLGELELWHTVTGMIKLVQGDTEQAECNRNAVGMFRSVFDRLGKMLNGATMQQAEQIIYLLSQLAFLSEANSLIILSTHGVIPRLVDTAFGDDEPARLDVARLVNNLAGASRKTALTMGNNKYMMDCIKCLATQGTFAVRVRGVGAIVALSRLKELHEIIRESQLLELAVAAASKDKCPSQAYALFAVAVSFHP